MAKDMIVVGRTAGVDEIQPFAMRDPMLLRVVAAQGLAVVELPFDGRFVIQPVVAARDEGQIVGPEREIKSRTEAREGWLAIAASLVAPKLAAVTNVRQSLAVEPAEGHDRRIVRVARPATV